MDIMTIAGIVLGLATLIGGYILEGGVAETLFFPTAVLIVFGGTLAATFASFTWSQFKQIGRALWTAVRLNQTKQPELVEELVEMATVARRDGILRLEAEAEYHPTPFIRNGLLVIVDGADPQVTKQMLELEIEKVYRDGENQAKIFDTAGGFAPTLGIIGTVLGLMNLLGNLQDPTLLAKSISVAFTATLYGVASANLIYFPIANKVKARTAEKIEDMELMMAGMLAIQAGDHPKLVRRKLQPYLREQPRLDRAQSASFGMGDDE
jgi:chemotaxis protein MotA